MQRISKKVFCVNCDGIRPYTLKSKWMRIYVKGIPISYEEYAAFCMSCGKEIYVDTVNDMNARARGDAYFRAR